MNTNTIRSDNKPQDVGNQEAIGRMLSFFSMLLQTHYESCLQLLQRLEPIRLPQTKAIAEKDSPTMDQSATEDAIDKLIELLDSSEELIKIALRELRI